MADVIADVIRLFINEPSFIGGSKRGQAAFSPDTQRWLIHNDTDDTIAFGVSDDSKQVLISGVQTVLGEKNWTADQHLTDGVEMTFGDGADGKIFYNQGSFTVNFIAEDQTLNVDAGDGSLNLNNIGETPGDINMFSNALSSESTLRIGHIQRQIEIIPSVGGGSNTAAIKSPAGSSTTDLSIDGMDLKIDIDNQLEIGTGSVFYQGLFGGSSRNVWKTTVPGSSIAIGSDDALATASIILQPGNHTVMIINGVDDVDTTADNVRFSDGCDLFFGETFGTRIGVDPSNLMGFWGNTPVAQPLIVNSVGGTAVGTDAVIINNLVAEFNDQLSKLKTIGIITGTP